MTALIADLVAALWRRLTCSRDHGLLMIETDGLYVYCDRCGFVSSGLVIETQAVRRQWRWDQQRLRFPRWRRAS
jgi:hypothetical protein